MDFNSNDTQRLIRHCVNINDIENILILDNVPVNIDGVLFLHITDTFKASYEVCV